MPDFAILLAPENLLMALGCAVPIQILYDWLLQRIMPPKSRKLFWGILVPVALVMCLARPLLSPELRTLITLSNAIVIPAALLEGPLIRRLVVCCVSMMLMVMAELGAGVAWIGMTGSPVMDPSLALVCAPQYFASAIVGYGVVMVPGMTGLRALYRRFFPGIVEKDRARKVRKAGKASGANSASEANSAQGAWKVRNRRDARDA